MSGKGSTPRPFSVDQKTFEDNWDKIFGQKTQQSPQSQTEDHDEPIDEQ